MVYQAEGNKFAWSPAVDNLLKSTRGTGIVDYNGFKVENSYDSDLAVRVTNGGAAEIQGDSVYHSDLTFNIDTLYEINDTYDFPSAGYNINTTTSGNGSARQTLEAVGGWVTQLKFYAKKTGTIDADLNVELFNETDDVIVTQVDVLESTLTTSFAEVTWTLATPVCLDVDKSYSIRLYRTDNTSSTDNTHYDVSNYYTIGYSFNAYDGGIAYLYNSGGVSWSSQTYDFAFYLKKYDYKWTSEARSTITLENTTYESSPYSIKWVYNDDGVTQYSNRVIRYIAENKGDWNKANKIRFAFYPVASVEHPINVYLTNNGTEYSIGTIPITVSTGTWNYIELDLPTYRDDVENIIFFVDGNNWSSGDHTFYIDSIVVYKKLTFTAPASAGYGRIDLVYIDSTGEIDVKAGTEVDLGTDSPAPKDLELDELGLALISIQHGDTSFTSDDIVDIRNPLNEEQ